MKSAAGLLPLVVAGCAASQTTSDADLPRSCTVADCFYERDVRDFDIIDRNTVVVYVGRERCPFVVELQDLTCDATFAPSIAFFQTALGRIDRLAPLESGRVCATTRGLVLYAGIPAPSLLQQQDAFESRLGTRRPDGFPRSDPLGGTFPVDPNSDDICRVTDIRSITDDQLVELLAEANAPPPPVGEGELEVPEEGPEQGSEERSDEPEGSPEPEGDEGQAVESTERSE